VIGTEDPDLVGIFCFMWSRIHGMLEDKGLLGLALTGNCISQLKKLYERNHFRD
jgi:hypothetical protein